MSPTQRPHKVVLWPRGEHGQVQVHDLGVERRVGDEVVVDVALDGEHFTHQQKDHEGEEACRYLLDHHRL